MIIIKTAGNALKIGQKTIRARLWEVNVWPVVGTVVLVAFVCCTKLCFCSWFCRCLWKFPARSCPTAFCPCSRSRKYRQNCPRPACVVAESLPSSLSHKAHRNPSVQWTRGSTGGRHTAAVWMVEGCCKWCMNCQSSSIIFLRFSSQICSIH